MLRRNDQPLEGMLSDDQWVEIRTSLRLSDRQLQITQSMFIGLTEEAIAEELALSRSTVHTHLKRLYSKVGVANRRELAFWFTQQFSAPRNRTP